MIKNYSELRNAIKLEKSIYYPKRKKDRFQAVLLHEHEHAIYNYMKMLRKAEYFYNNRKNPLFLLGYIIMERRKNLLGQKLGIFIGNNAAAPGLKIFHYGTVIINADARIAENCKLHGNNCIGNNGKDNNCPIIGKNVDIGFGAQVIGNVTIADDVIIGSGAIVVKDCHTKGAVLVGIPAHEV